MDDDELLRRLAEVAREDEEVESRRLDSGWDALAAGTLSADEEASLAAAAERSPEGRRAFEAFQPLGRPFRARMAAMARSELAEAGGVAGRVQAPPRREDSPARAGTPRRAERPERRRRAAWLRWSAAAAGLAAAGLLVMLWPGRQAAPLPGYSVRLAGGVQEMRSGTVSPAAERPAPSRFVPGNFFELVLTPSAAVPGRLEVATFERRDGRLLAWPAPVEISEHGAVRIAGRVGEGIRLPTGDSSLVVVVGRPGSLPSAAELGERLASGDALAGGGWVAFALEVAFAGEP